MILKHCFEQQTTTRPRVVKRDLEDFHIEEGEPSQVDHLLVIVHGIGAVCDLKFRTIEEVGKYSQSPNKIKNTI